MGEKKYLGTFQKIGYASGDMACNFGYALISAFMMIYLTNAVGLNSAVVGTLMMISKIFDGITDVFFGTLIDKTHSKLGKARPWMLYGQIGVSLCLFLVFCIPSGSKTMQYAYFFVFYTAFNAVFFTANNIAYSTLSALITRNSQERVQLGSIRFMFSTATYMAVMSLAMGLVEKFGGGTQGWRMVALICAVLGLVVNTFSALSVKELPDDEGDTSNLNENKTNKISLKEAFVLLFKNPYYIIIVLVYLVYYASSGITSTAAVYFYTYYFENPSLQGIASLMGTVPIIIALIVTPTLVKKVGSMRKVDMVGYAISTVLSIVQVIVAMQKNISVFMILAFVKGLAMGPFTGTINALIAETADYTYRTQGKRIDGTMFSCSSIGVKVGGGIGTAVAGWLLAVGGFNGLAEVQTTNAINMIFVMNTIIPILLSAVMVFLLYLLKVEKVNKEIDLAKAGGDVRC